MYFVSSKYDFLNRAIRPISYNNWQIFLRFSRILLSLGLVSTNLKCVMDSFFIKEFTASIKKSRDDQEIPKKLFFFLGHLSHSGDLLLWVGVRCRASYVVRRALTSSPQKLLNHYLPNLVCRVIRGSRPEIVNFMIPHPKGR